MSGAGPFADDIVATVAAEHDIDRAHLAELLADHQALFRHGDRTLEDTVYEWRTGLPGDPLVERTDDAVYLDAPDHAWADLLDWLDLTVDSDRAEAIRAVHTRQFERDRGDTVEGPLVVARD